MDTNQLLDVSGFFNELGCLVLQVTSQLRLSTCYEAVQDPQRLHVAKTTVALEVSNCAQN